MNLSIRHLTRQATTAALVGVVLVGGSLLTAAVIVAPPAGAATTPPWEPDANSAGGLTFYNSSGTQITSGSVSDSPVAAYVQGSATIRSGDTKAALYGYLPVSGESPSQWSGEPLGSSTTYPNASAPASLSSSTLPVETGNSGDETIAQLEADFPNTDTSTTDGYAGMYVLRLKTTAVGKAGNTTYDSADIQITGSGSTATWAVVYPVPTTIPTATTLAATPSGSQPYGTNVTLTATVTAGVAGTVQFENGTTAIGDPVTVSGGTASTSTTTLPVGDDTLNAVFSPTAGNGYAGSTGSTTYTITALASTTSLAATPASPQFAGTSVTLTATVTAGATGTVQFENGTSAIGDPVAVSGGTASISTTTLPAGTDTLNAVFSPTTGNGYTGSTGTTTYTVTPLTLTTTSLVATPTSPQPYGTSVTLTATVTSGVTGTVQFENGTSAIGDPVTVSGGTASISTTSLPAGTDTLNAVFSPTTGNGYTGSTGSTTYSVTGKSGLGYLLVASNGIVLNYGDAVNHGSASGYATGPIVGIATTADSGGYWEAGSNGEVYNFGDAPNLGPDAPTYFGSGVVGIAATPDGGGYWLATANGGVFAFGDAPKLGSLSGLVLNKPIVGIAATQDGQGFWLLGGDGGIFSFGDANFYGSTGALVLNKPVVGMSATPDGGGYWLVAADGGIFSFGDANFHGSTGALVLNKPVVGMTPTPRTAAATGWWRPTVASSASATRRSTVRPVGSRSSRRSSALRERRGGLGHEDDHPIAIARRG